MKIESKDVPGPRRDYVGYGRNVPKVVWPNDARLAVNIIINYEESSEVHLAADGRNEAALGELAYVMDPRYRDLAMESVYEYGSRAGIWRLQRLFDQKKVPVTFFAAAVALERNPEVAQWLRDSDHEPCSHGWRWEEMWLLTRDEEKAHMAAAIASFEETCGQRPLGWYCRYGPSVNTRELVVEEGGFVYDSDAYNDDLPYLRRGQGHAPPDRALHLHLQRRSIRHRAGLRRPERFLRPAEARLRSILGGRGEPPAHDERRPASAAHRPGRPRLGAR